MNDANVVVVVGVSIVHSMDDALNMVEQGSGYNSAAGVNGKSPTNTSADTIVAVSHRGHHPALYHRGVIVQRSCTHVNRISHVHQRFLLTCPFCRDVPTRRGKKGMMYRSL